MSVLLWFKKDLRLADHAALARAATIGPVLPLYILEPELWAEPDMSGRQFHFLKDCLRDLHRALDGRLVIRVGAAPRILQDLSAHFGTTHLISHEETGNAWTYARDRAVAA